MIMEVLSTLSKYLTFSLAGYLVVVIEKHEQGRKRENEVIFSLDSPENFFFYM